MRARLQLETGEFEIESQLQEEQSASAPTPDASGSEGAHRTITDDQVSWILAAISASHSDGAKFLKAFGMTEIDALPEDKWTQASQMLCKKLGPDHDLVKQLADLNEESAADES